MIIGCVQRGMTGDTTVEVAQQLESVDSDTEEYLEMEQLFDEHGKKSEPNTLKGTAVITDFGVKPVSKDTVVVELYFSLPNNSTGRFSEVQEEEVGPVISRLFQDNYDTEYISDVLGVDLTVQKQEEDTTWTWLEYDTQIREVEDKPTWDASERNNMDELFNTRLSRNMDENEDPTSGEAVITDYYVRRSASNITQDLEIGIELSLPDNSTKMYECIHDADHPDGGLQALLSRANNPDKLYKLKGEKVPVLYNKKEEQWEMHLARVEDRFNFWYTLERFGIMPTTERRKFPIKKTYQHAKEGQHDQAQFERQVMDVERLESMEIAVHTH